MVVDLRVLARAKPVMGENGYSAMETLKSVSAIDRKVFYSFFTNPRNFLEIHNPKYGTLTPLYMYLAREQHGIKYSEWDKEDPMLKVLLGYKLWEILTISCISSNYKYYAQRVIDPLAKHYRIGLNLPFAVRHIVLQTWLAHPDIREDCMILDLEDWDNMPESIYKEFTSEY